jgi:hypothetical protein
MNTSLFVRMMTHSSKMHCSLGLSHYGDIERMNYEQKKSLKINRFFQLSLTIGKVTFSMTMFLEEHEYDIRLITFIKTHE